MNLRERIADWISGGAVTMWHNNWAFEVDDKLYWVELASHRRDALVEIAAMETPGANGTVKRMAKLAREALKK